MLEIATTSAKETQKIARMLAEELLRAPRRRGARVVALKGDLGAGKTTFAQGFAAGLGVKENVLSPTFVLMKIYPLGATTHDKRNTVHDKRRTTNDTKRTIKGKHRGFKHFIHIDCYRLASPRDLAHLGFKEILKDKDAIILIEWADRIKKILPPDAIWLRFTHGAKQNERCIMMGGDRS